MVALVTTLFKLLNNKAWIFLIISFLPFPFNFFNVFCPGYNFLLILFFTILLYLEKNKKSDKLIGFMLGIAIIIKQTTGVFLLIPTIILFFKERKRFVNRIKYIIIPPLILLIYLFLTKSLISFFDLCFLGLIDFGNENTAFSISYLLIVILIVSYVIYKIVKNKNVSYIYLITMLTFVIPICDCYHMILFFSCFLIVFLNDLNINLPDLSILSILVCFSFLMCFTCFFFKEISNFKVYITNSKYNTIGTFSLENEKAYDKLNKISKKYKKVIYLCGIDTNLYLKIINKRKIDYYDYCNHGNFGYNGIKKLLKKLSNERDTIVIIRNYDISKYNFSQFSKELVDYVKNNYKLIEKVDKFLIYYKE